MLAKIALVKYSAFSTALNFAWAFFASSVLILGISVISSTLQPPSS